MGRTQHHYDYPEVHPPHPQQDYRAQKLQTNVQPDNRYSYTKTPVEAQHAQYAQLHGRQSTVPPLPAVPEHLQNDIQKRQQQQQQRQHISTEAVEAQQALQIQTDVQEQRQPPPLHEYTRPHDIPVYQTSNPIIQQYHYAHTEQQQQYQQHQQLPPQPLASLPPQLDLLQKQQQQQQQHQQQKVDPIKKTPDHPNYHSSTIVPDENPLLTTPTSPGFRKDTRSPRPLPRQNTTNIPVLSPSSTSYNFTSSSGYAPLPPQPVTGGSWTHSLCSCSEPTVCLTGLFCPCILYGRVQHRLQQRSERKDPTNMLGYSAVNGSCVAWALLCGVNALMSGIQKTRVRRSYELDKESGSVGSDCLEGCCCCCCVLARNEKEVRGREEDARGGGNLAGKEGEGYLPPIGMTFAPPPPPAHYQHS